jgi:pimeloyl-ACP methyl ester carboxylesterase
MNIPARRLPHISASRLRWIGGLLGALQDLSPPLAARVAFRLFLTPARRKLNPVDEAEMYRARIHFLRWANADQIRAYEWGEGPRTLLLLHGWGSHAARFTTMARFLADRGWRVLALDAPGHGESQGSTSSLPQFVGALEAVIQQLGPVQALIGHSMGALAIANRLSDQSKPPIAALTHLVLISMPSGVPFLVESFEQLFAINAATRRHCLQLFKQRFGGVPEDYMALSGGRPIDLPLLLIHDAADDIVPHDHSQQLAARLPRARLCTTHQLGHSGLLRDPSTLATIAAFLDGPRIPE